MFISSLVVIQSICNSQQLIKIKTLEYYIYAKSFISYSYSRGKIFKKGVKSLMRMGRSRNPQEKEALLDSDDSAQMTTVIHQRGHTTETSDLSSDNESIHSLNTEYSPNQKK